MEARAVDAELDAGEGPVLHPLGGTAAEKMKCDGLALLSRPPGDEELDMVAAAFDAGVHANVAEDRMEMSFDVEPIAVGRQLVCAGEA